MKIQTTKLQEMVSKAAKGASCNKLIPKTEVIAISVVDGVLQFITTDDYSNYLYVRDAIESEEFYAVVKVEQFSKLISRMTSETTSLSVVDNVLKISGNGSYSIGLEMDESTGGVMRFPNPLGDIESSDATKVGALSGAVVKTILNAIKPSLATTMETPIFTNYFLGDEVMATDTMKIGVLEKKLLEQAVVISSELMDLLDIMPDETIDVFLMSDTNRVMFSTPKCVAIGNLVYDPADYPTQSILAYVKKEYPGVCKLPKAQILQMIDRLSLFVGAFDDGNVSFEFTQVDGLKVMSRQSDGVETIEYVESTGSEGFSGMVNLEMLKAQVKAQTGDTVKMFYGDERSLRLVDENTGVMSVIALIK